jgi:hypothetical protein
MLSGANADTIYYSPTGPLGTGEEYWGPSTGQSYGQIFTAPQTILDDYTLILRGDPFPFVSQIYHYDSTSIVGPALYTAQWYF